MKKKVIFIISFMLITLVLSTILLKNEILTNDLIYDEYNIKDNEMLSMMLETGEGTGEYKTTTSSTWPTEGYKFNSELSRCENGGDLSWDDTNKIVVMTGNTSDKCYVYFDVKPKVLLANYIKSLYTGIQGENSLYFHDSNLTNGAKDNSYRYAGASDTTNNFICFGNNATACPYDNLYRIIGVIDGKVKLIKYDYMTADELKTDGNYSQTYKEYGMGSTYKGSYSGEEIGVYKWSSSKNTWSESLLNKTNLNTNFINYLGTEWANKIATTPWKVGGNISKNISSVIPYTSYENEITSPDATNSTDNVTEYQAKIGLMYVSDYGYAASPSAWTLTISNYNSSTATSNNWMYLGLTEYTITRDSEFAFDVFGPQGAGDILSFSATYGAAVRVVFYLESSVGYKSGIGSVNDPIILEV